MSLWSRIPVRRVLVSFAFVFVLACILSPIRRGEILFLNGGNLADILRQVSEKGILAVGMTVVVLCGGVDLSVGSVLALGATFSGILLVEQGFGTAAVVAAVLLIGTIIGVMNGAVITLGRIPPFVATLAMMSIARGLARLASGNRSIPISYGEAGAPPSFALIADRVFLEIRLPVVLFLAVATLAALALRSTSAGREVYAVGGNEEAARLSGARILRTKLLAYGFCGFCAALAGIVHFAQLEEANANDGVGYELDAIAAVVIGGTSLAGGSGGVIGSLFGMLIMGILDNVMGLRNYSADAQLLLKGLILVGAVLLQTEWRRRPGRALGGAG